MVNTQYNTQMMCYRTVPPEAYVLLLTSVTPTNSIKNKINKNKINPVFHFTVGKKLKQLSNQELFAVTWHSSSC